MANTEYVASVPATPVSWNVSYNNAEEIVVEAITEKQAIAVALERLGLKSPVHPIRAWLKREQS
jgi:hypothetical protein